MTVDRPTPFCPATIPETGDRRRTERLWGESAGGSDTTGLHRRSFEIQPVGPFRLDLTVWALRRRPRNRIDQWDGVYRRVVLLRGEPATIEVEQDLSEPMSALAVTVTTTTAITSAHIADAAALVDRLLGASRDLAGFYEVASADPLFARLENRFRGLHPPRFPTLFEALANAVANQQLTLEVGIELLNRFTDAYGTPGPGTNGGISSFPPAELIAGTTTAPLRDMGFSGRKAEYLIGLAESVSSGSIDADELGPMDRTEATDTLLGFRGIGRWSAEYVLLRGLGRLEVFPADDVGARNKLHRFLDLSAGPTRDEILSILERWHPYAGMVYFHLLLDGLADHGTIGPLPGEPVGEELRPRGSAGRTRSR